MKKSETLLTDSSLSRLPRLCCKDVWHASLVKGAVFSPHDIPCCPTFIPKGLPQKLISFPKAKTLYRKNLQTGHSEFCCDAFVHFYCDDQLFDGPQNSIWAFPDKALQILKHFGGIITPDYSTYSDFPDPLKRYNTYRMRAFGFACYTAGIPVINNVRWGTDETWGYCFDGIPQRSVVCIGTVASGLRELSNRTDFDNGFYEMIRNLSPRKILVYGSAKYSCFQAAEEKGVEIISFPSETNLAKQKGGLV